MLHRITDENDPRDWFCLAEERLKSADSLWRHEGLSLTGIESLQEAVERYLKGFLIAKAWKLRKIHDLRLLIQEAKQFDQRFGRFASFATELTEDFLPNIIQEAI